MIPIVVVLDSDPAATYRVLANRDALILPAVTIAQAWELVEKLQPTLFICDLNVPNVSANSVYDTLREKYPDTKLLLTGPPICRIQAINLNKQDNTVKFIAKPWIPATIREAMHEALPQKKTKSNGRILTKPKEPVKTMTVMPTGDAPRYRLDEKIGEGGTGQVYRAHDLLLDMTIAIKILNPEMARNAEALAGLQAEARISLQLTHPNIVRIYDFTKRGNVFMLIMEYIKGGNLHTAMKNTAFRDMQNLICITNRIADALDYAHQRGVLHSDLTPSNVLFKEDGTPLLIDFGIASLLNRQSEQKGQFVAGTPSYMSPEQIMGEPLTVRSDIFSFSVLVYQMLSGYLPQADDASLTDLAYNPRPALRGFSDEVAAVLQKGLALKPDERWESSGDFAKALSEAIAKSPPTSP